MTNARQATAVPTAMASARQVRTARETRQRIKRVAGRLAAIGSVLLLPLTLLSFVGWQYPFELLSHFQSQYFLATLACAGLLALLRRWRWFALSLCSLVVAGGSVLPYHGGGPTAHAGAAHPDRTVRVVLANVLLSNRDHGRLLEFIRRVDADVLVFQEINERWKSALAPITTEYPYLAGKTREDPFGTMVYSRLPILEHTILPHGDAGRWSMHLVVEMHGTPVSVVCTHPKPPVLIESFEQRNEQLDRVTEFAGTLPRPLVLVGDLNMTMWSPWYRRLCDRMNLANARRGAGVLGSWPANLPAFMRIPIDHVLVSPEITVTACRLGEPVGSDHLPVIVDLQIP